MTIYTVHAPRRVGAPEADPLALAFIKEGFNWPALVFPVIWLIFRRMWLVLVLYLAGAVILAAANRSLSEFSVGAVSVGFWFLFALEANDLRRWTLGRAGWRLVGIAEGRNLVEAERRYFSRLLAGEPLAPGEAPAVEPPPRTPPAFSAETGTPVVGLFPQGQS